MTNPTLGPFKWVITTVMEPDVSTLDLEVVYGLQALALVAPNKVQKEAGIVCQIMWPAFIVGIAARHRACKESSLCPGPYQVCKMMAVWAL